MLQSAVWKLGRKQHELPPLATPVYHALNRLMSSTNFRNTSTSLASAVTRGDTNRSQVGHDHDPFEVAFSTRRSTRNDARHQALETSPSLTIGRNSTQPLLSLTRDRFEKQFGARQKIESPTPRRKILREVNPFLAENSEPDFQHICHSDSANIENGLEFRRNGQVLRLEGELYGDSVEASRAYLKDNLDWAEPEQQADKPEWLHTPVHIRRMEKASGLAKSWMNQGPESLFNGVLLPGHGQIRWWERVAALRTYRLPVILLQMYIRRAILIGKKDTRHILDLLPKGHQRRTMIRILGLNAYSRQDIDDLVWIVEGKTDQERADRFLELRAPKPIFLLRFLLRPQSTINDVSTLHGLIKYIETTYDGCQALGNVPEPMHRADWRLRKSKEDMDPNLFASTLYLLSWRCLELEPRLTIKVSDLAIKYIENLGLLDQHSLKTYTDRCTIFNETLEAFGRRKTRRAPPRTFRPLTYVWEAQRALLSMSAGLPRPLILSRKSFLAVREVLAGMDKNPTEAHSSMRHAQTWPPYLEPGDGLDEMTDPDDNWSRSVHGGVLQQEAGFAKNERDLVMDILQGTGPDGTPTVQQRLAVIPRSVGLWEASIRATRNSHEAWIVFQNPPERNMKPGLYEYAAMFKKLHQKENWEPEDETKTRPGDRDVSFPTKGDVNWSEFERARRKPPTVSELYQQMRREGIRPVSTCLEVLVANSSNPGLTHSYLHDSGLEVGVLTKNLLREDPNQEELLKVPISLFTSYIQAICSFKVRPKQNLERAIRLCRVRFYKDEENRLWAPLAWGYILKALHQPFHRYGRTLHDQLELHIQIIGQIEQCTDVPLSTLVQFCKLLRKAVGVEINDLFRDLEQGKQSSLSLLYDSHARQNWTQSDQNGAGTLNAYQGELLKLGACRMKQMFESLVKREETTRELLEVHAVDEWDQMMARQDPVRSEHALEMMLSLAYLGEFEDMGKYVEWLLRQWARPGLLDSIHEFSHMPRSADFFDILCAFRLLAEQMLPEERVAELRQMVEDADVDWIWPTDEAVMWFREIQPDMTIPKLAHVLEWIRYRQAISDDEYGEQSVAAPNVWEDPIKEWVPTPRRSMPLNRFGRR